MWVRFRVKASFRVMVRLTMMVQGRALINDNSNENIHNTLFMKHCNLLNEYLHALQHLNTSHDSYSLISALLLIFPVLTVLIHNFKHLTAFDCVLSIQHGYLVELVA